MFLRALCPCQRNQSGAGNFEPDYTGDNEGSAGGPIVRRKTELNGNDKFRQVNRAGAN